MSYAQAMKWNKKHRKGTRQPVLMGTNSGFWPSHGFLVGDWFPYLDECKQKGLKPLECEQYYKSICRSV